MKKYIIVLFLITFIIPSVALASWWNPFTWKIFHKPVEPKIEQPIVTSSTTNTVTEESPKVDQSAEIEKLKKEVEGLKKKTNSAPPISDSDFWSSFQQKSIPVNNNQQNITPPSQEFYDREMLDIELYKTKMQIDQNESNIQNKSNKINCISSVSGDAIYTNCN